jgi:hypothetical protein
MCALSDSSSVIEVSPSPLRVRSSIIVVNHEPDEFVAYFIDPL